MCDSVQLLLWHAAGPAIVYGCYWGAVPAYILAELLGGIAAALISWPLYGTGLQLGRCVLLSGYSAASCIANDKVLTARMENCWHRRQG
jgi:hypothetical protein